MAYDAASLSFVRDLTDLISNTKGRLNFGYMRYNFTGLTVNNYEATTGFEYALHEKWTFLSMAAPVTRNPPSRPSR